MTARSLLALLVVSTAVSAFGAEPPGTAFETIQLKHLTAAEVAPLLGGKFRYIGPSGDWAHPEKSGLGALVPQGIDLVTAAHQGSSQLLVAGTVQGVAELRTLVAQLDNRPQGIEVLVAILPSAPINDVSSWQSLPEMGGFKVRADTYFGGADWLIFPRELGSPMQERVELSNLRPEYLALPPFANWPRGVMCFQPRLNADETVGLSFGFGAFEKGGSPAAAVEAARSMPATLSVKNYGELAITLERNGAVVTVVLMPSVER
jgi:hypothetical protein